VSKWHPNATLEIINLRAELLNKARQFFQSNNYLEVETPFLSRSTTPDPNIESFITEFNQVQYYLHTSPEFPMKRLLASGSGAIYQICKVFRQGELGKNHNPEFTMIEWYQPQLDYHGLMQQLDKLVRVLLQDKIALKETVLYSYRQVFKDYLALDPFVDEKEQLLAIIQQNNIQLYGNGADLTKDALLDLLMTHLIQPRLPEACPVFIYDYPASQAALANIRKDNVAVAERFELFINSMELANGYQELLDADEQQRRFESENKIRSQSGQQQIPIDKNLIAALNAGMPMTAGVALGFDRLIMLAAGVDSISDILAFDIDGA